MDEQSSYGRLKDRLEEIVVQVKSKDVPLEKSLDLYDEALRIGGRCVEKLEQTDFTSAEIAAASDANFSPKDTDLASDDDTSKVVDATEDSAAAN